MKKVAVCQAKRRWSELLVAVGRGETFTITRRGVAVARLSSADVPAASSQRRHVREAFAELHALRNGVRLDMPLRQALEAGRD